MPQKKGRETTPTGGNGKLHRRGEGLNTGPVGNGPRGNSSQNGANGRTGTASNAGRPSSGSGFGSSGPRPSAGSRPSGGGTPKGGPEKGILTDLLTGGSSSSSSSSSSSGKTSGINVKTIIIIVIAAVVLFGGGGKLFSCLTGGSSTTNTGNDTGIISSLLGQSTSNMGSVLSGLGLSNLLGGSGSGTSSLVGNLAGSAVTGLVNNWVGKDNTGKLNKEVASGARPKYTTIKGNNKDKVTIMVYMCGTDLESKYGMASSDLAEMKKATFGSNVKLIVYTGGCKQWKSSGISNTNNMILQIEGGKIKVLNDNEGKASMVTPSTLSGFIQYCKKNFPANRYDLILWDHGGGSVTGYGYDEKYASSGSMNLTGIRTALEDGGVQFDFIGFDACLMATAETAFTLGDFADYMIASEESEPGIGWHYTNWLTKLGENTSLDTPTIGKYICDDFVSACASSCAGQSTTLSVIDLAEFTKTVPDKLTAFAKATTKKITGSDYQTVAKARSSSRAYAQTSGIDQIDLVHFALNLDTTESKELADAILSAVKYNRTSSDMTNSYGVSIYFPYQSTKYVDQAISTYKNIGMEDAYSKCIKEFASMEVSGQAVTGGNADYSSSILGLLGGGSNQSNASSSSSSLLSGLLSGALGSNTTSSSSGLGNIASLISGLGGGNLDFLTGRTLTNDEVAEYLSTTLLDPAKLNWKDGPKESLYITLSKDEWALVTDLQLSMYYDDGEGFIDLGMDRIFDFDDSGNLLAPQSASWLTINGELVPFYFDRSVGTGDDWQIEGHVPVLIDGERANLIIVFNEANPKGFVAGAAPVYEEGIEVIAKNVTELEIGAKIDFIADYYTYDGVYENTYMLGDDSTIYDGELKVGYTELAEGKGNAMYRLTDIYNNVYWSEAVLY